jgi:predicted ATP-grasp superfamily ATP-dependent carboligase
MLAEAANKAGFKALVIDLYADLDTWFYAVEVRRVPSLAIGHVAPILDDLMAQYKVGRVVYGSGLEYYPETLDYLDQRMTILGNAPAVFRNLQDKAEFFAVLAELEIPFPAVSFIMPDVGNDWLIKPIQGQGGLGICRSYRNDAVDQGVYWQKFQLGTPGSVLFLADMKEACLIGFNTQFNVQLSASLEFVFSGLINHSLLSRRQRVLISGWLARCVQAFGLKGLNSLDFIHDGERVYVLEINPRPSASMQLYGNLLAWHMAACHGKLPGNWPKQKSFTGFHILYADKDLRIPDHFVWPDWARDRPKAGEVCGIGQPLCTVMARRDTPEQVKAELAARQQQIFNQLTKV